jgi:tetratricopeptide (TPR) repeat protein
MRARLGDFDGAFDAVSEFRRRLRELGREREYAVTATCAWDVCLWAGHWEQGEAILREGYDQHEQMGNKAALSMTAIELGSCLYRRGSLDEAEHYAELGGELSSSDDVFNEAHLLRLRANVQAARGDLAAAESLARQAVEVSTRTEFLELTAAAWLALAEILGAGGNEGSIAAHEALALYERKGNLVGASWARSLLEAAPG